MKIRVWLKNNDNTLKLIPVNAPSRKEALKLLKNNYKNQEIHKIEYWNNNHWNTYKKPIN